MYIAGFDGTQLQMLTACKSAAGPPCIMLQEVPRDIFESGIPPQHCRNLCQVLQAPGKVAVVELILLIEAGGWHLHGHIHRPVWAGQGVIHPAAHCIHPLRRRKAQGPLRSTQALSGNGSAYNWTCDLRIAHCSTLPRLYSRRLHKMNISARLPTCMVCSSQPLVTSNDGACLPTQSCNKGR